MKTLIVFLLIAVTAQSQVNLDSIVIYSPNRSAKLGTIHKENQLARFLDSIYTHKNISRFNTVRYYTNGKVVQCRVRKRPKQRLDLKS